MPVPHKVKLYVHNAKVPRAFQISRLRENRNPSCYGFYAYQAYVNQENAPASKTQEHVKDILRTLGSKHPL